MTASTPSFSTTDPSEILPTLLDAFGEDPVMRWLYPDDEVYTHALPEVVELAAGSAFDAGTIEVVEDGAAVAIWAPPGDDRDPEEVGAAWAAHFEAHIDPARIGEVLAWGDQTGRFHPTEPHWYLAILGVSPAGQGRGLGSTLLRAGLERCDRDGVPAYLESGNPRNRTLYERHGFEAIGQVSVADSPPTWPMLRRVEHDN